MTSEDDIQPEDDDDDDLDLEESGLEDEENIDVEALRRSSPGNHSSGAATPPLLPPTASQSSSAVNSFLQHPASSLMAARFMLGSQHPVTPVRPTPFSALAAAAAAYSAGLQHSTPSWPSVHGHYNPATTVFPSFGNSLSNSSGKFIFSLDGFLR